MRVANLSTLLVPTFFAALLVGAEPKNPPLLRADQLPPGAVIIPANEIGKCTLDANRLSALLKMEKRAFDQAPDGWRGLDVRQCRLEAALVIELYLQQNSIQLGPFDVRGLLWHAGQLYALAGRPLYGLAVQRMRAAGQAGEADEAWSAYVTATVAFLESDRAELERRVRQLASGSPNPNASVAAALLQCFDREYSVAYVESQCRALPNNSLERSRDR